MADISISEEDKARAEKERYDYPDVHVQRRLHALYFMSLGYNRGNICKLAGISYPTLRLILKLYKGGGFDAVCRVTYYTPHSELDEQRQTIEEYFLKNPPANVAEACNIIKNLTGLERGETQVRNFLVRLGMRPRKSGSLPGKCDPKVQEEFLKKS